MTITAQKIIDVYEDKEAVEAWETISDAALHAIMKCIAGCIKNDPPAESLESMGRYYLAMAVENGSIARDGEIRFEIHEFVSKTETRLNFKIPAQELGIKWKIGWASCVTTPCPDCDGCLTEAEALAAAQAAQEAHLAVTNDPQEADRALYAWRII